MGVCRGVYSFYLRSCNNRIARTRDIVVNSLLSDHNIHLLLRSPVRLRRIPLKLRPRMMNWQVRFPRHAIKILSECISAIPCLASASHPNKLVMGYARQARSISPPKAIFLPKR